MPGRSSPIAPTMRRTAVLGLVVLLGVLVLGVGDVPRFARPEPPAKDVALSTGWQLASARDVTDDGSAISLPDYRNPAWHDVRRMPATVLQALQADGTY